MNLKTYYLILTIYYISNITNLSATKLSVAPDGATGYSINIIYSNPCEAYPDWVVDHPELYPTSWTHFCMSCFL